MSCDGGVRLPLKTLLSVGHSREQKALRQPPSLKHHTLWSCQLYLRARVLITLFGGGAGGRGKEARSHRLDAI